MELKPIIYNNIIELFSCEEWDFSYLLPNEMMEVLNFPIKIAPNHIEHLVEQGNDIPNTSTFLTVVKRTKDYDYALHSQFIDKCKQYFPELKIINFWCNYKYAIVKSGLGQYAKNSLVYHQKFQFETHFSVFLIFNPILNLPNRNPSNFNILSLCNNCQDCFKACPVQAIHNQEKFLWIDMDKCDNFCFFGNHKYIPSIKQNHILLSHLTQQQKENIIDYKTLHQLYPEITLTPGIKDKDGKIKWYSYPTCRECTSQIKCSKYNGKYPYGGI